MRLLLLSNSRNPNRGWLDHAESEIRDFLGSGVRSVLFIPFAAARVGFDAYLRTARERFERFGYRIAGAHRGAFTTQLARADAVAVGGGNTFRLLDEVRRRRMLAPLAEAVRAGMPYIGWSAGSVLACPTIRTTNDMPIVEPASFAALALVPFQINAHYTERRLARHGGESRDERLAEFLALNPRARVIGLREGSLLRREGDRLHLRLGPGARLFQPGRPARDITHGADLSRWLSFPRLRRSASAR